MKNKHLSAALLFCRISVKAKIFSMIFLVILADFLFYNHAIGWVIGLFGCLMAGVFFVHNSDCWKTHIAKILLVLTLVQCFLQIEKQSLLSFILMVFGLISLALLRRNDWQNDASIWLRLCRSFLLRFLRPLNIVRMGYQRYFQYHISQNVCMNFIRGWFLPVTLSLIFLCLFANANPIFMDWFDGVDFIWWFSGLSMWRILFWLVMVGVIFSIIRPRLKFRVRHYRMGMKLEKKGEMNFTEWAFSKDAVLRCLVIFNLMFAFQTAMDMNYLWAGSALPDGISYAQYAHKGAYPLIVTALLAGVFVLVTQSAKAEISGSKLITQLMYLWVLQNVFLVFSSIYRTFLYVEIYALTYWRVAAFVWMGLVVFGLVWIVLRGILGKSNTWLINANVLTLFSVLYVISFINVGGMIAYYNYYNASYPKLTSGTKVTFGTVVYLDTYYLQRRIGSASIPALLEFETASGRLVTSGLRRRLRNDMDDWRRWTYSEHRLLQSLESTRNE